MVSKGIHWYHHFNYYTAKKLLIMKEIVVTQQEIQEACKKQVFRDKSKYYRKKKHKNKSY